MLGETVEREKFEKEGLYRKWGKRRSKVKQISKKP